MIRVTFEIETRENCTSAVSECIRNSNLGPLLRGNNKRFISLITLNHVDDKRRKLSSEFKESINIILGEAE